MLHVVSTVVLVLIALGIVTRRRPDLHLKFMVLAFVIDLSLVVYIEATRQAVATVAGQFKPLVWLHAAISLSVLVLYVVQIALGRRLLMARTAAAAGSLSLPAGNHRHLHRHLGICFVVMRLLNYATAFMI